MATIENKTERDKMPEKVSQAASIIIRNKGSASDPIQQLFVEKIREYRQKSPGGQLVDPSPAILKEMKSELTKLEKRFGGGPNVDMGSFPTFNFDEPKLDPIDEPAPETKKTGKKAKKKPKKKGSGKKKKKK